MPSPEARLTPQAFAIAFKAASRKLWFLAAAIIGCRSQAEDILQESAVTALGRLSSFEAGTNFDAWMAQIVRYTALNQARRHYRSKEHGVDELSATAADEHRRGPEMLLGADGHLAGNQEHFDDSVMAALAELGAVARACFLLRTLQGLAYTEIAELLGIPEGTAMSHVHRSRSKLRLRLEGDAKFDLAAAWRAS